MISGREIKIEPRQRAEDLRTRHARLQAELVDHLEQAAVLRNHGLLSIVIGWEHWLACAVSNYLIEMVPLPAAQQWLYLLPWLVWGLAALVTAWLVRQRHDVGPSPLGTHITRLGLAFLALCGQIAGLNVLAGLPLFVFLPALATLSAFAFLVLASFICRRFLSAALLMFVAGLWIALFPAFGFLLYGSAWLIVLQTLGIELSRKRAGWLAEEQYRSQVLPFARLGG